MRQEPNFVKKYLGEGFFTSHQSKGNDSFLALNILPQLQKSNYL
jgi:hypothetical protein